NPNNIALNTIGTYASVVISNDAITGNVTLDGSPIAQNSGSLVTSFSIGPLTPSTTNEWAVVFLNALTAVSSPSTATPPGGWSAFQNSVGLNNQGASFFATLSGPQTPNFTLSSPAQYAALAIILNSEGTTLTLNQQQPGSTLHV